jgi:hypothetical protein
VIQFILKEDIQLKVFDPGEEPDGEVVPQMRRIITPWQGDHHNLVPPPPQVLYKFSVV